MAAFFGRYNFVSGIFFDNPFIQFNQQNKDQYLWVINRVMWYSYIA